MHSKLFLASLVFIFVKAVLGDISSLIGNDIDSWDPKKVDELMRKIVDNEDRKLDEGKMESNRGFGEKLPDSIQTTKDMTEFTGKVNQIPEGSKTWVNKKTPTVEQEKSNFTKKDLKKPHDELKKIIKRKNQKLVGKDLVKDKRNNKDENNNTGKIVKKDSAGEILFRAKILKPEVNQKFTNTQTNSIDGKDKTKKEQVREIVNIIKDADKKKMWAKPEENLKFGKAEISMDKKNWAKKDEIYEVENLIEDADDYDKEMKRQKKKSWAENLIPKSNKFLYNNKKYHSGHEGETAQHSRKKRSVLSSIFVQMPEGDDGSAQVGEMLLDEDYRDKKSKGSTTVCLEIKSDPSKPPSTICGPEIKPNSPFSPQNMYSIGQNEGFFYADPQPDRTIWSLNPLHEPYYSTSVYKETSNRDDPRPKNGNRLNTLTRISSSDKITNHSKGNSIKNNVLSVADKSTTLKTMPAIHVPDSEKKLGHTSRTLLYDKDIQAQPPVNTRNKFKDLDLNLDAEMTSDNVYVDPNTFAYNQYNDDTIPDFDLGNTYSDQTSFYPYTNFDNNGGVFKMIGQNEGLQMSNEPIVGFNAQEERNQRTNDFSENSQNYEDMNQEATENNPNSITPLRGAYEYYPEYQNRVYPYRPTYNPHVPPRPYPYRPEYEYDRYDPDCKSGKCRSTGSASLVSFTNLPWGQPTLNQIVDIDGFNPVLRSSDDTFVPGEINLNPRGNTYYGRPYPYRPPYEYQGNYPSRIYPYRPGPHSYPTGYTYPYDPNCRAADGRSCREAEEEISTYDSNISPSNTVQNYADPIEVHDATMFQARSAKQSSPQTSLVLGNEVLGSYPLPFRTHSPVEPLIAPAHAPVGLACNVVHAPVLPTHTIVSPVQKPIISHFHKPSLPPVHTSILPTHTVFPITPGIGIGHGAHHIGGGILPSAGFHGIGGGTIYSGVGTHDIGGSHGISHHHLLREASPVTQDKEQEESFDYSKTIDYIQNKDSLDERSKNTKVKATVQKPKPSAEEIKEGIREKLRAAEKNLQSSRSAILEKINRNITKEKKVMESDDNKTNEGDNKDEPADTEAGDTFTSPAMVQLPTGGRVTYTMNPTLSNLPMMLGSALLTRAPSGSPAVNLKTPFGGTLTYDSPFFGYGQPFLGSTAAGPAPWYYGGSYGPYHQVDVSKCNCQQGSTTCSCPINSEGFSFLKPPPKQVKSSERSMSASIDNQPFVSLDTTVLGASIGKNAVNTPSPNSNLKIPATLPCARGSERNMLGASMDGSIQLPAQRIESALPQYPVSISFREPIIESVQYQHPLNPTMYNIDSSPMVGFASLSEMKENDLRLKQNTENMRQDDRTKLLYEQNIYKSNFNEEPCNSKNIEGLSQIKTSPTKITPLKFKALEQLPSKILTTKPLKPVPILKLPLPKPLLKNANLRTVGKEPCS